MLKLLLQNSLHAFSSSPSSPIRLSPSARLATQLQPSTTTNFTTGTISKSTLHDVPHDAPHHTTCNQLRSPSRVLEYLNAHHQPHNLDCSQIPLTTSQSNHPGTNDHVSTILQTHSTTTWKRLQTPSHRQHHTAQDQAVHRTTLNSGPAYLLLSP